MPFQSFQNYAAGCICENLIPRHAFEMPPQSGTPFVPVVSGIATFNLVDLQSQIWLSGKTTTFFEVRGEQRHYSKNRINE